MREKLGEGAPRQAIFSRSSNIALFNELIVLMPYHTFSLSSIHENRNDLLFVKKKFLQEGFFHAKSYGVKQKTDLVFPPEMMKWSISCFLIHIEINRDIQIKTFQREIKQIHRNVFQGKNRTIGKSILASYHSIINHQGKVGRFTHCLNRRK